MKQLLDILHQKVISLPRQSKRVIMMTIDAICIPFCLWASYSLIHSDWWLPEDQPISWWVFPVISVSGVFIFSVLKIYRTILRYVGIQAFMQIIKGVGLHSVFLMAGLYFYSEVIVPRSVLIIHFFVCLIYVSGSRFFYRYYYHWILQTKLAKERVIVYGAGGGGVQVALALANSSEYRVVAFIDDNVNLHGSLVQGVYVYSVDDLEMLKSKYGASALLLAMPSVPREGRGKIVMRLGSLSIKVLNWPSVYDLKKVGDGGKLKEIGIEDILGREPIPPKIELLEESIENKTIIVTGAGGTIGSEICRQAIKYAPQKIVLFDNSEYNLYKIEQELQDISEENGYKCELVAVLGSVCNKKLLSLTVSKHQVDTFYHTAAYKHVPIVERNEFVGIRNNVHGTRTACECAMENGVERFVLISTDKAVRPTNVMGATKRLAELIVQDMDSRCKKTTFCIVRFGNVLGSSGSVVPLFRQQILAGGPVTVTHPEVTRYFMTIREAALLVLQAGSMGRGGDIFVLDMGEQIKILDLAKQMIHLSGLTIRDEDQLSGDIEIKLIGLRPGEKIREELLIGSDVVGTRHPRIMRSLEESISRAEIDCCLQDLGNAEISHDVYELRSILSSVVHGYQPEVRNQNNMMTTYDARAVSH